MRSLIFLFFSWLALSLATSCISDSFSSSSHDILSFSTDTVSFDTVFTDLGTPTARLKVYNRAKKSINISSIRFKNPDSNFQMNVDGVSASSFSDVEIRGGDSIFVFIECFIDPTASNEPFLIEDKLEFVTNGVNQEVQVEAYGQNVTRLRGVTLQEDLTLTPDRPYVVFDSLVVPAGRRLSIEPDVRLLFHDGARLVVRGTLDARGEAGKMIQMRGDRLGMLLSDASYDILAGQWAGISFAPESFDNRMEYVNMRSTSEGIRIDSCANLDRTKLTLVNSWLHNSQSTVLESKYAKVDAYGVCFSEASQAVVALYGGINNFSQCTIANNYLFTAISQPLLSIYHCLPQHLDLDSANPLMTLNFDNGIIYGLAGDINEGNLKDSDCYLRNVLLKSNGSDDEHFIDCIWGEDPLFYTIRQDYIFDYRLKPDSPAIGKGNPALVNPATLFDMDGIDRLASGLPALGAYAAIKSQEQ